MTKNLAVILVFLAFGGGCSSASNVPFHIYNSPLLSNAGHPSQRRSRDYDPLGGMGDHPQPERVYAVSGKTAPKTKAQAKDHSTPKMIAQTGRKLPSLATAAMGHVGAADQTTMVASAAVVSGYTPASAAEYAWQVFQVNGIKLAPGARTSIAKLYKSCKKTGSIKHEALPKVGDLVFFHNVTDVNGDKRNNDWYAHVAVVEAVNDDGTVTAAGYAGGAVTKLHLNLSKPDATTGAGGEINSRLRDAQANDAPFTQYFASQLFAGYCSALGDKSTFITIDNWTPGAKVAR